MCSGAELGFAGTLAQGLAANEYQRAQGSLARADAASERDAASQQAERILRETQRRRSSARAATAASGARVDEFSLANEQEILQAGETDAAMAILSGKRRSDSLELQGRFAKAAGQQELYGSLFKASHQYKNWAGAKQRPAPVEDRSFSYSSLDYRPNRAGR